MTKNQIDYRHVVELERANRANEGLTSLRDSETARANRAREAETNRSNLAREFETTRSNLAGERLRSAELGEKTRSNLANEFITQGHYSSMDEETRRANLAREAETNRSNLAKELETVRHNHSTEEQSRFDTITRADTATADRRSAETIAEENRLNQRVINAERNASRELQMQMQQQGMNERQAKQIAADAIKVLHDDIKSAVQSGKGQSIISRMIDNYYINQIERGN